MMKETETLETVRLLMTPEVLLKRKIRAPFVTEMSVAFVPAEIAGALNETRPRMRSRICACVRNGSVQV